MEKEGRKDDNATCLVYENIDAPAQAFSLANICLVRTYAMLHYDRANYRLSATILLVNLILSPLSLYYIVTLVSLFAATSKSYFRGKFRQYVISSITIVLKLVPTRLH